MGNFVLLTILYFLAFLLSTASITILIMVRAKKDGIYIRLFIILIAVMMAFIVCDYFCFRLPHYVTGLYSEQTGHAWAWITDVFFIAIVYVWIVILRRLTEKGTIISERWLMVLLIVYTIFVAILQHFITARSLFTVNYVFNAFVAAVALYYLIVSVKHWDSTEPKGLSTILSSLLLMYIAFVSYGDFTVHQSLLAGKVPGIPVNPLIELVIIMDVIVIVYLVKVDPLRIRDANTDVKRLQILSERFGLTERESDVMAMICQGKSNPQIAEELYISESTVKRHLTSIYHKTDTTSRYELIVLFCQDDNENA